MTRPFGAGAAMAFLALGLSACSFFEDDETILPGERIPVRQTQDDRTLPPGVAAQLSQVSAPQPLAVWSQVNGSAQHAVGHVAASSDLSVAWRADIGAGGDGLTATPIVVDGVVYALDAAAQVSALSASGGAVQWRTDLTPEGEESDDGFGGGLAYDNGRIFVTTGFGQVVALDASTGEEVWRQRLTAPARAAPAVASGTVVAIARDNTALAYDTSDGAVRWRVAGATSGAGVFGGASPAISPGGVAILPFGSGELVAVRANSGQRLWADVVSGGRRGFARSAISDISSDPVIQGVAVIAGNQSGRLVAIDGRNGRRGWTRDFGARNPVWPDGETLFLISDDAQLKRLSGRDGATIWTTALREYRDEDDREDAIRYGGPILAGGRLLLTSSDGDLLSFDPATGEETSRLSISGAAGLGPVAAGGTVYVVTSAGSLVALR
ncbi:MAG: PQQ-binding-like beta-propeller repeat protein [Pseudomonadota bacterium]